MDQKTIIPRTSELIRPEKTAFPYDRSYHTEVLVVGCGFAGLNAAVSAREAGREVLVIDKGKPGYSGLSPWPSSFRWFDPERDDAEAFRTAIRRGGDYISNLHWYDYWIHESKGIYERLTDFGILAQYPRAKDTGDFFEREDFAGYRATYDKFDRHKKWVAVLERYGIPYLSHTMVADLCVENGKIQGALAMHVPSGEFLSVAAKAVILATGGGSVKPTGYPVGTDTFDGEYMAFQLGLPIAGKEFEDFHATPVSAPGNVFLDNHWQYLENIWLCGGDITAENARIYADNKGRIMAGSRPLKAINGMPRTDGSELQDVADADFTRRGASRVFGSEESEVRSGKRSTPLPASTIPGAAIGMCCHLTSGIFSGMYDDCGRTEIEGLFAAGDGIHATAPSGAAYPCGVGFTSCFTSIDGDHAGKAAADYARTAQETMLSEAYVKEKIELLTAPLRRERGFDPNWARDVLHAILSPYWVSIAKSKETLEAALVQVRYMKEHVIPKLTAGSGHDLRLAMEMEHKVLSSELKLIAGLFREESRGNTYRTDFPYRDDDNFLCYVLLQKDGEEISVRKEPVPEEWTGDLAEAYEKRYGWYFPGEPEAKGFPVPQKEGRK